jgi:6-phosphogluconolactonase
VLIYTGSYTPDGEGGIRCWRVSETGDGSWTEAHPVTPSVDPSFLAWHPSGRYLYAVSESAGRLLAFERAADGSLRPLGDQPTGGDSPCHLSVDPTGTHVVVANYGDGVVSVHPIGPDGGVLPPSDRVQHAGTGPVTDRQEGPHAHMATFAPGGDRLLVADLGTDTVHEYRLIDGQLSAVGASPVADGTGPRHVAFHPDGLAFISGELNSTIQICRYDADGLRPISEVPATFMPPVTENLPSHLECSADGRFLYVTNRGADCVTTFAVEAGGLRALADTPTGHWPRHFTLVGDLMYVAGQEDDAVTVLRVDERTGIPAPAHLRLALTKPTCLLPEPA